MPVSFPCPKCGNTDLGFECYGDEGTAYCHDGFTQLSTKPRPRCSWRGTIYRTGPDSFSLTPPPKRSTRAHS